MQETAGKPVPVGPLDLLVLVVLPALLAQMEPEVRRALLASLVPKD
jgi:hypothetical protein